MSCGDVHANPVRRAARAGERHRDCIPSGVRAVEMVSVGPVDSVIVTCSGTVTDAAVSAAVLSTALVKPALVTTCVVIATMSAWACAIPSALPPSQRG